MSEPLVSIVIPCYNGTATLPMALASVVSQTYEEWECIVVDDGSTDHPERVVQLAGDSRIWWLRLARNGGRAVAFQAGFEHAKGEYIGTLGADDWYYPSKLETQVDVLKTHKHLAALGTSMAIVNTEEQMVAVRGRKSNRFAQSRQPLCKLANPGLCLGTCLWPARLAKRCRYDAKLVRSSDFDFMLQMVLDRHYGTLSDVLYAYRDPFLFSPQRILQGLQSRKRMYSKYKRRFPFTSRLLVACDSAKGVVYRILFAMKLGRAVLAHNSRSSTRELQEGYESARSAVVLRTQQLFAHAAPISTGIEQIGDAVPSTKSPASRSAIG